MKREDGMRGQIETFFRDNPEEALLLSDICLKWAIDRRQAAAAVRDIAKRNLVRVVDGLVMGLQA